jgi:hypothetical protein
MDVPYTWDAPTVNRAVRHRMIGILFEARVTEVVLSPHQLKNPGPLRLGRQ